MSFEAISYEVAEGGVAVLTLNRPDKLNAFNTKMMNDVVAAFDRTDADDAVGCVVLTGAGRAYCAGADLSEGGAGFAKMVDDPARAHLRVGDTWRDGGGYVSLRIFESKKPVIAAINGAAVGIGATMLMPCDMRLASTTAKFGFAFVLRGLVPEAASSWFLPRVVGINRALEWTMTGRMVEATEALDAGLVRSIHEPDALLPAALALAREVANSGSRVSVALTRAMLWRMLGADHPMTAHRIDSRAILARRDAPDTREGIDAFLEKRPARYRECVSDGLPDIWAGWEPPHFY